MFGLADKTEGVGPLLVQETPGPIAPAWPGPVLCHHQHYPDVTHTLVFFFLSYSKDIVINLQRPCSDYP